MSLLRCGRKLAASWKLDLSTPTKHSLGLSFLYTTPTILYPPLLKRRNYQYTPFGREAPESEHIPFENDEGVSRATEDEGSYLTRRTTSTVTETERRAFEKLFFDVSTKSVTQKKPAEEQQDVEAGDQDMSDVDSLIMDVARTKGSMDSHRAPKRDSSFQWPDYLKEISAQVEQKVSDEAEKRGQPWVRKRILTRSEVFKDKRDEEYKRVEKLLMEAQTDVELWGILEKEVFAVVKALNLGDGPAELATFKDIVPENNKDHDTNNVADIAIIGPIYPALITVAIRQLRFEFPASLLPHSLLPAMKSLGRSSFVLGASSVLYNELIAITWTKYADFEGINELLGEMDNGVVDYDHHTLDLLTTIQKEVESTRRGKYGPTIAAVSTMDLYRQGFNKFKNWKQVVERQLQTNHLHKAAAPKSVSEQLYAYAIEAANQQAEQRAL